MKQQFFCRMPQFLLVHLKRFHGDQTKDKRLVDVETKLHFGGQNYQLLSIVLHDGSEEDGHYGTIRLVKEKETIHWIALDDEKVFSDGLESEIVAEIIQKCAYVALYAATK